SQWNCHEPRAGVGGLRSVVAATAQPAGTARKSGQKQSVKPSSGAVAATTERSPPVTSRQRRRDDIHKKKRPSRFPQNSKSLHSKSGSVKSHYFRSTNC